MAQSLFTYTWRYALILLAVAVALLPTIWMGTMAFKPYLEIHPRDAKRYKISNGEAIKVSSRRGAVKARAIVTANIIEGAVFIPYHFGYLAGEEESVNSLTNRSFDECAQQPEYKACAVKVENAAKITKANKRGTGKK